MLFFPLALVEFSTRLDKLTGTQGTVGYIAVAVSIVAGHALSRLMSRKTSVHGNTARQIDPLESMKQRNFTLQQLKRFDGTIDSKSNETKAIYLSLNGTVFDVSEGRDFYGSDGPYSNFAGHECGVAFAKMSFSEDHLGNLEAVERLSQAERDELENWIEKFTHYRRYPIVGRVVPSTKMPDSSRIVSKEDLSSSTGNGTIPDGYCCAEILVAVNGLVFDMSFGGVDLYGPGGPYHRFAGKDATRALALMSLDDADLEDPSCHDLNEKQKKTLQEWATTFKEKKQYPIVGRFELSKIVSR